MALIFASSSLLFAAALDKRTHRCRRRLLHPDLAARGRHRAGDGRMKTSAAVCGSTHAAIKRWERCITTRRVAHLRVVLLHPETKHSVLPVLALAAGCTNALSRHDSEAANNARKRSIYATHACSTACSTTQVTHE